MTREELEAKRIALSQKGIDLAGDVGTASKLGMRVSWTYAGDVLSIEVKRGMLSPISEDAAMQRIKTALGV